MSKKISLCITLSILLLIAVSPLLPIAQTTEIGETRSFNKAYVSPILSTEEFWEHGAYLVDPSLRSFVDPDPGFFTVVNEDVKVGQVILITDRSTSINIIKGKITGLVASLPTHLYNVVIAIVTREQVEKLAGLPGVIAILPDIRLDALINAEQRELIELASQDPVLYEILEASTQSTGSYHYTVEITGSYSVWSEYSIKGQETKLAIIDTGVDYGSPGLGVEAIARDEQGLPMIFDASSLGLVLTPVDAVVDEDGYITVDPDKLYVFQPPYYVWKWTDQLYVRLTGCRTYTDWVPFPEGNKWYVGSIVPAGSIVKFGLAFQDVSFSVAGTSSRLQITVPVILVDSDQDGFYDTLYVDTTTVLNMTRLALTPSPCSVVIPGALGTVRDYSFADEAPISYGNEVIARDLDGDGIRDFSLGTLAGYVYDAVFAIILEKLGMWRDLILPLPPLYGYQTTAILDMRDPWRYEPVALVWPGLDPLGDYVVIQYDYNSHGTYCANTAAGRDLYVETGYGVRSISGQAPETKIAASPALYYGSVAVSIYFFSGFDLATPYGIGSIYIWPNLLVNPWIAFEGYTWRWEYTGLHQVDITSNSYGASGWALWGWNTGSDPTSVIMDYTIMKSGTLHFVAAGNGGPGYGTVASPSSSSLAVSVGAAVEFTYRPIYGYAWPGASRQVITWSNRGPTEIGVVKPDLVGVGAFAYAIGRTWDALNNLFGIRRFNGSLAYNLFSGTSQATPMVAGAASLVVTAYKLYYEPRIPPYLLKTILMNYAVDMGYDELIQGAGFVNAYRAINALLDLGYPRVYSRSFINDVLSELSNNYNSILFGETIAGEWYEPKIFIPLVRGSATRRLTIEGSGSYKIYAGRLEQVSTIPICNIVNRVMEPTVVTSCIGDNVSLNVTAAAVYGHLVLDMNALKSFDYFEIEIIYPFEYFETGGRTGTYNLTIGSSISELAYWIDVGADGVFSWLETARIMYDIRRANALRLQIGNLEGVIEEIEYLALRYRGVDPTTLPRYLVMRLGVSGATYRGVLPLKIRVVGYQFKTWSDVIPFPSRFTITDGSKDVLIIVRQPARPGFYSGYIVVEETTRGLRYLVPISFFVPIEISREQLFTLTPYSEATTRKNTYLRGVFDYAWRYESGDWRVFKIVVSPVMRNIWALGVRVTWPTYDSLQYVSNIDVHVYGPYTYYMVNNETLEVYEYKVNTVQLAAELSRDPAGGSGYNPTRFWDSIGPGESMIIAPTSGPGIYRVVIRNIQFRGVDYLEPYTLEIIPISARTTLTYSTIHKAYQFTVVITTPGYSVFQPLDVYSTGEAIQYTALGAYYVSDITTVGLEIIGINTTSTPTRYTINVLIKKSPDTPSGVYLIPLSTTTQIPVTTIGWLTAGTPNIYFQHYEIPLTLRLRII
ncbi:MAG: S8 family serine peptidase [Desulfurococcaceae archaeon]